MPPFESSTVLDFRVGYLVESILPLEEYKEDLEMAILGSALAGALQCIPGSPLFLPGGNMSSTSLSRGGTASPVRINTTLTGDLCFPEVDFLNECVVLETYYRVIVAEEIDSEVARFLGYVEMQQDMDSDLLLELFAPDLDRIRYVSPLPLLPPLTNPQEPQTPPALRSDDSSLSVTPWTVAAVLGMCE